MQIRGFFLFVAASILMGNIGQSLAAECDNPLPELKIERPAKSVPNEIADFVGRWDGMGGDGYVCTSVVVEKVDEMGNATIIHSWGSYRGPSTYVNLTPGWTRDEGAKISGGYLAYGERTKHKHHINESGELIGERISSQRTTHSKLKRNGG